MKGGVIETSNVRDDILSFYKVFYQWFDTLGATIEQLNNRNGDSRPHGLRL